MSENKSSISKGKSYKEISEFWDNQDLGDYWNETEPVDFEVDFESEFTYYAIDKKLSKKIQELSKHRGISPGTLLNLWVQEKLHMVREEIAQI